MPRKSVPVVFVLVGVLLLAASVLLTATPEAPHDGFEVTWLGDTLLGDRAEETLETYGYDWAFALLPRMDSSEVTVVNCEAPLTVRNELPDVDVFYEPGSPIPRYVVQTSRGEVTRYIHRSSPAAAASLAAIGVNVATLCNNHSLDQGPQGLQDTREALGSAGIAPIGAGLSADEALQPYVADTPYGRLAVFAFGEEGGTAPDAAADSPGICALNETNVSAARVLARELDVQWMVAAVHWGNNYTGVLPVQEQWARRLAESDFNLVVGTGPHVVQRIDIIGRTPVLYSLGNFVFQTGGRFTESMPGYGLVATTVLGPKGFREIRLMPIQTDNDVVEYQPRPCDPAVARQVLEAVWPSIRVEDGIGVLQW